LKHIKEQVLNVAEAKKHLSDLLGRVAYGRETILITRRGRPMAKLVLPVNQEEESAHLASLQGWLEEDDPFFKVIDEIVMARAAHIPRVYSSDNDVRPDPSQAET
jgi:prevent-host-death family protein